MSKRVVLGIKGLLGSSIETEALQVFAVGAPLAQLGRWVLDDTSRKTVRKMHRIGVARSRAKVREILTKEGYEWRNMVYAHGKIWTEGGGLE